MKDAIVAIEKAMSPVIIQAENPDGDSLASALALEELLGSLGKQVSLFCSVDIPRYLRYLAGWDRVTDSFPPDADLFIAVDVSTESLLLKFFKSHSNQIAGKPFIVIDHHSSSPDLPIETINVIDPQAVSAGEVIYSLIKQSEWNINPHAAAMIASSILSDSLGLSSPKTTSSSIRILAEMVELGADLSKLDDARREYGKKSFDIFKYKGHLFERVELALNNQVAMITIPWEEIEKYSDAYNPSMLIIDEMRLIEDVKFAVAFKTYPDKKITAKLRANSSARFMDTLAAHFGGGGHPYAAGFKVYDVPLDKLKSEVISTASKLFKDTHEAV